MDLDPEYLLPDGVNVFSVALPECVKPRGREEVHPVTGELVHVPMLWSNQRGEITYYSCRKNSCPRCSIVNARRAALAVHLSAPVGWFSFTLVGDTWSQISERMKLCMSYIRNSISDFEWCWAVEENPRGTGNHVHGYFHTTVHGSNRLENAIEEARRRAGFGARWRWHDMPAEAGPAFCGYPMKALVDPDAAWVFLGLNGTPERPRVIHSSRDFWRDGDQGVVYRTRAEAERAAVRRSKELFT